MTPPAKDALQTQQRRAFWLRHLHQWHWISSGLCLIAMILFAATGITLNHSAQIEAHPVILKKTGHLPRPLLDQMQQKHGADSTDLPLPEPVRDWLKTDMSVDVSDQIPEWSPEEVYLALPRPGGDAWLRLDLDSGDLEYEITDRGWIAYFNDLHKGRNTGSAWNWFIDIFAATCLIFCITGLFLLKMHARNRPTTWPLVALGLVLPLLLAFIFIH
ncbi:PepSY-associated TM helix domain-containing protein [Undibacterium sp. SXout7W]|uniref:PepSY-associated TM helix domain-containing protein n=1 Tax=Undibacterium sp. SXout7W TaxID=3413049 RepID=UPI003BF35B65